MSNKQSEHNPEYREEILQKVFKRIGSGESCTIVGLASMGKTRLQDYLVLDNTMKHYLDTEAEKTLIFRVDCNRLLENSPRNLFELFLTSIIERCMNHPELEKQAEFFTEYRREIIRTNEPLLALRDLEFAVLRLVKTHGMRICFLLDEFDEIFQEYQKYVFSSLRAIRDANKTMVSYIVFMRDLPKELRDTDEVESFSELISAFTYALTPYVARDALEMINNLENRWAVSFDENIKAQIVKTSGGHPGLIFALSKIAISKPEMLITNEGLKQLINEDSVNEECRKLIRSLSEDEQRAIKGIVHKQNVSVDIMKRLISKGLVTESKLLIPLLVPYIEELT